MSTAKWARKQTRERPTTKWVIVDNWSFGFSSIVVVATSPRRGPWYGIAFVKNTTRVIEVVQDHTQLARRRGIGYC